MSESACNNAVLVVDIGNTNIVCGIYKQDSLAWFARFQSSSKRTADEYYSLLKPLLNDHCLSDIRWVAMGSVVPELSRIWLHLMQKYTSATIVEINALSNLGLSYQIAEPSFIGADLVANAYAAWKKYGGNNIVIDLGTATTIQLVSARGLFVGAAISPGLRTGASFLFEKAALLSEIELSSPSIVLGTNTKDALLSGIVAGHAMMLESFLHKIKSDYPQYSPHQTILTGGIADLVKPMMPNVDIIDKTLTLDGLFMAAKTLLNIGT